MRAKDAQVRKLMEEKSKHGKVGRAAMMAGMDRKRAEKYLRLRWRRWRKEGDGSTELQKRHLAPVDETTVKVLTSFHNMGILRKMNIDEDATDAR